MPHPVWHTADQVESDVSSSTQVMDRPDNVSEGDLLVFLWSSGNRNKVAQITAPSGWVPIIDAGDDGTTVVPGLVGYAKIATASEPADYTFSSADAVGTTIYAIIGRATGHDGIPDASAVSQMNTGTSGSGGSVTVPAIGSGLPDVDHLRLTAITVRATDVDPSVSTSGFLSIWQRPRAAAEYDEPTGTSVGAVDWDTSSSLRTVAAYVVISAPIPEGGTGTLSGGGSLTGIGQTPAVAPAEGTGTLSGGGALVGIGETPAIAAPGGTGALTGGGTLTGIGQTPAVGPAEGTGTLSGGGSLTGIGFAAITGPAEGAGTISGGGSLTGIGDTPGVDPDPDPDPPIDPPDEEVALAVWDDVGEAWITVPVRPDGFRRLSPERVLSQRGYEQTLNLPRSEARNRDPAWSVQTPFQARSEIEPVRDDLLRVAQRVVDGYLMGGQTHVFVRNLRVTQSERLDHVSLTFDLLGG